MKKLLLLALLPGTAWAAPFAVADVASGVTSCGVYFDSAAKVTVPATGNQCKYDLSGVSVGNHSIKMTAITTADPVWGTQESPQSLPLDFSRPAAPSAPTGLVLTP